MPAGINGLDRYRTHSERSAIIPVSTRQAAGQATAVPPGHEMPKAKLQPAKPPAKPLLYLQAMKCQRPSSQSKAKLPIPQPTIHAQPAGQATAVPARHIRLILTQTIIHAPVNSPSPPPPKILSRSQARCRQARRRQALHCQARRKLTVTALAAAKLADAALAAAESRRLGTRLLLPSLNQGWRLGNLPYGSDHHTSCRPKQAVENLSRISNRRAI